MCIFSYVFFFDKLKRQKYTNYGYKQKTKLKVYKPTHYIIHNDIFRGLCIALRDERRQRGDRQDVHAGEDQVHGHPAHQRARLVHRPERTFQNHRRVHLIGYGDAGTGQINRDPSLLDNHFQIFRVISHAHRKTAFVAGMVGRVAEDHAEGGELYHPGGL